MPKVFTSKNQKIGELGEGVACAFLVKQGFSIVERNYTKKWGEIDIVAKKDEKIYFIEVKSMSGSWPAGKPSYMQNGSNYRPEENMHPAKLRSFSRTIQTYLLQKDIGERVEWQVDLVCVFLNMSTRTAKVERLENIIL